MNDLKPEASINSNVVRCNDLRVLRDKFGRESVVKKMLEPDLLVEMSKKDMKRQLYTSQEFLEADKLVRAATNEIERFIAPCSYSIDEKGDVRFVLLDGHHRALLNYTNCIGLTVRPTSENVPAVLSFRNYYRMHVSHTQDW